MILSFSNHSTSSLWRVLKSFDRLFFSTTTDTNLISDEDFIIFYKLLSPRNPDFAYDAYNRFDLDEMNDDECNAEFRVRKRDLPTLAQALNKISPSV